MKAIVIGMGPDSGQEQIREVIKEFEEQTGLSLGVSVAQIEGLFVDSLDIGELGSLSIEMAKINIDDSHLDTYYEELRENKQEIKHRSLALSKKPLQIPIRTKSLIRNKNSLQRRNKNSRV